MEKIMAKKIIIYWRDIPAQVLAQRGRVREKVHLSERFQKAIDRAAMRAGKGSSDAYIAEWRRESSVCEGDDLKAIVASEAQKLESEYSDERLLELIRGHGSVE
jgi:hypothetical protein